MEEDRVRAEFKRIKLTAELGRDRQMIDQYEIGLEFHRQRVENSRYELGRLDEKLGGSNDR